MKLNKKNLLKLLNDRLDKRIKHQVWAKEECPECEEVQYWYRCTISEQKSIIHKIERTFE
jgi:hypothetical protein